MFGNRTQSLDWVRLGSVIELNRTHKKILSIERNRMFGNRTVQQSNSIGDPKDMTVILLREVLLEMGVNLKASDSKKKLVERVKRKDQRPIGPITRQGNLPQTPSSFKIKHEHHPIHPLHL